ncbi:hypothetical protein [Streptomyces sp. NPDC048277]
MLHAGPQDSASAGGVDQITLEVTRQAADTDSYAPGHGHRGRRE